MKKVFLLTCLILLSATKTFAYGNYSAYCPVAPNTATSKAAQIFSTATGGNFIAEQFAQNMIQNELKKFTGQDFSANVKAITPGDLMQGKFKSVVISGENIAIQGIYASSVNVHTVCDYNSIDITSKPVRLRENLVLDITAELSANDIRNSLIYSGLINKIDNMKTARVGFSRLTLDPDSICIRNGKVYYTLSGITIQKRPQILDINVGADVRVQNGSYIVSKFDATNLYSGFDLNPLINAMNPAMYSLNYTVYLFGNQSAQIQIQNVFVNNDKLVINGIIFIPKSV